MICKPSKFYLTKADGHFVRLQKGKPLYLPDLIGKTPEDTIHPICLIKILVKNLTFGTLSAFYLYDTAMNKKSVPGHIGS